MKRLKGKAAPIKIDREQSLGRKQGQPTTHQETFHVELYSRSVSYRDIGHVCFIHPVFGDQLGVMWLCVFFTTKIKIDASKSVFI